LLKVKNKVASSATASPRDSEFAEKKGKYKPLNQDNIYNEISDADHITSSQHQQRSSGAQTHKSTTNSSEKQPPEPADIESAIQRNVNLKRAMSNLKSPERQILYNDWFKIVKKMENDPKFDLEALIRTRGRFTDREVISYRDKFLERTRAMKASMGANYIPSSNSSKSTNSYMSSPRITNEQSTNPTRSLANTKTQGSNNTMKAAGSKPTAAAQNDNSVKLTLEKSDINLIKDIMTKKGGKQVVDLTKLAIGNASNAKSSKKANESSSSTSE
jgi:hypothetical protein